MAIDAAARLAEPGHSEPSPLLDRGKCPLVRLGDLFRQPASSPSRSSSRGRDSAKIVRRPVGPRRGSSTHPKNGKTYPRKVFFRHRPSVRIRMGLPATPCARFGPPTKRTMSAATSSDSCRRCWRAELATETRFNASGVHRRPLPSAASTWRTRHACQRAHHLRVRTLLLLDNSTSENQQ